MTVRCVGCATIHSDLDLCNVDRYIFISIENVIEKCCFEQIRFNILRRIYTFAYYYYIARNFCTFKSAHATDKPTKLLQNTPVKCKKKRRIAKQKKIQHLNSFLSYKKSNNYDVVFITVICNQKLNHHTSC